MVEPSATEPGRSTRANTRDRPTWARSGSYSQQWISADIESHQYRVRPSAENAIELEMATAGNGSGRRPCAAEYW